MTFHAIRWQNSSHKAAKLEPQGSKLAAKVCTAGSNFFSLRTKKYVLYTNKIAFVLQN